MEFMKKGQPSQLQQQTFPNQGLHSSKSMSSPAETPSSSCDYTKKNPELDIETPNRRRSTRKRKMVDDFERYKDVRSKQEPEPSSSSDEELSSGEENGNKNFSPVVKDQNRTSTQEGILNNHELSQLLSKEGKNSSKVDKECRKISKHIQSLSTHFTHVEPTYKKVNHNTVIFLVFADKEIEEDKEMKKLKKNPQKWEIELSIVDKYSDESLTMLHCEENNPLPEQKSQIGEIINKHLIDLMSKHKYLSSISASSVKSTGFGTNHKKIIEPCIALNVIVQGFIPLNEDPFPEELSGIRTDVREGSAQFCAHLAKDFHKNVRMGCKITSSIIPERKKNTGTLGGFIEHPDYGLCGITCAHVVLDNPQKLQAIEKRSTVKTTDLTGVDDIKIYQPEGKEEYAIGKVVEVAYNEGENGRPGVDLALFKVEKRAPRNGKFPYSLTTIPCETLKPFKTGLVWEKTDIPSGQNYVRKFGYVTGHTKGIIEAKEMAIRIAIDSKTTIPFSVNTPSIVLSNQYLIKTCNKNIAFCEQGDSGVYEIQG